MKPDWTTFDNVDLPEWIVERAAEGICSFLNAYIPKEYSTTGTRYHTLSRYPGGRLYFHLLKRPVGV